jgi:acid phosphatase (class A)
MSLTSVAADEVVHHPAPKDPVYLNKALYSSIRKELPALPKKGSAKQKADEASLRDWQSKRTEKDCERAREEMLVNLENFFGRPNGPVEVAEIQQWSLLFAQVRNDADYFVQKMKKDYPRDRPFAYLKGIEPCIPKEVTKAYPSGHTLISRLYALMLSDLRPAWKEQLNKRANQIAEDRVLAGMHHPTDIEAGTKMAEVIYRELKKSEKYQEDFRKAQSF